jgi:CRISP-associated protein Cas1
MPHFPWGAPIVCLKIRNERGKQLGIVAVITRNIISQVKFPYGEILKIPSDYTQRLNGAEIFARATTVEGLLTGWERVWNNRGAAGGDGVRCETFALEVKRRLLLLSHELQNGSYQPGPLRRIDIPKSNGGVRTLSIPCVRDRVAQSSVAVLLTPLLDAEFEDGSYGYRPGRSVKQAVEHVRRLRADGFIWTVDADISRYFDTIPHEKLMDRILRSITESPLTELIGRWLETSADGGRGVPQGSPISPLLANLYLDDLDEALSGRGLRIVRFADDFVVLTKDRDGAERALADARRLLADQGLALNAEKTRIRGYDDSLRFLGHLFVRSWLMIDTQKGEADEIEQLLARVADADRKAADAAREVNEVKASEESAGYDRGLRVLYINEPGRRLGLKNESFAVTEGISAGPDDETPPKPRLLLAVHASRVDRIELGPNASADLSVLKHALASGVHVAFINGHGEALGHLVEPVAPYAARHLAQARHRLDDQLRLDLARRFVDGRLRNQRAVLRRLNQRRGSDLVVKTLESLNMTIRRLPMAANVEELLGHEGNATASYWRAWSSLLMHGFSLPVRKRTLAPDAVNTALNAASALLTRDIGAIVIGRGLHPGFGFLHAAANAHDGCVYDLMEEFRAPMVEGLVLYLFNNRMLMQTMFQPIEGGGVRIINGGMAALIRGYEERAESLIKSPRSGTRVTWRRLMIEQAEKLAAHVEGGPAYQPYVMDY